jgi:hypothetical protein
MRDLAELERLVLDAHERDDRPALIALYAEAGEVMEAAGKLDAACFVRTQAYVLALESGERETAERMHRALARYGREE